MITNCYNFSRKKKFIDQSEFNKSIGNQYSHYTRASRVPKILRTKFNSDDYVTSTYKANKDFLRGKNITGLVNTAMKNSTRKMKSDGIRYYQTSGASKGSLAGTMLGDRYKSLPKKVRNPISSLANINGISSMGSEFYNPKRGVVARINILDKNNVARKEGDRNEYRLPNGISRKTNKMSIEVPAQNYDRSNATKFLRKYMKGHKNMVVANKENLAFMYGTKYPGLNKFKSEKVIGKQPISIKSDRIKV